MKKLAFIVVAFLCFACKKGSSEIIQNSSALFETFKTPYSGPKISVHRGGKGLLNYPENCLETLQYINDSITAIYEIDVSETKDGHLVLMHDKSIDRTTTGTGLIKNIAYNSLKEHHLKDDFGNITDFKIPLLSEVLEWSEENDVILTIDIKRGVSHDKVINAIEKAQAEDTSVIITYSLEQAQLNYIKNPNLILSVSARNMEEFEWLLDSSIPTENMIAFTGTRLSDIGLYEAIHAKKIVCMLGTLGNLDKQAEVRGDNLYSKWLRGGVDILATDRPFEVDIEINK